MSRLASVTCTNSAASRLPAGEYDIVTLSGFGRWSKDAPDAAPRFATAQFLPGYVSVFVFQNPDPALNVVLSNANTKPAEKPLP